MRWNFFNTFNLYTQFFFTWSRPIHETFLLNWWSGICNHIYYHMPYTLTSDFNTIDHRQRHFWYGYCILQNNPDPPQKLSVFSNTQAWMTWCNFVKEEWTGNWIIGKELTCRYKTLDNYPEHMNKLFSRTTCFSTVISDVQKNVLKWRNAQ